MLSLVLAGHLRERLYELLQQLQQQTDVSRWQQVIVPHFCFIVFIVKQILYGTSIFHSLEYWFGIDLIFDHPWNMGSHFAMCLGWYMSICRVFFSLLRKSWKITGIFVLLSAAVAFWYYLLSKGSISMVRSDKLIEVHKVLYVIALLTT